MRRDTSFEDRKLSTEEFAEKYWKPAGKDVYPYQYHTGSIEDGRDEREQFVFNNIRALYDMITRTRRICAGCADSDIELRKMRIMIEEMQREIKDMKEEMRRWQPDDAEGCFRIGNGNFRDCSRHHYLRDVQSRKKRCPLWGRRTREDGSSA